jgi:hypothetical protein
MANRRLAPPEQQPKDFAFTAENKAWADKSRASSAGASCRGRMRPC